MDFVYFIGRHIIIKIKNFSFFFNIIIIFLLLSFFFVEDPTI